MRFARNHFAVVLLGPLVFCSGLLAGPAEDRPVDITPAANVDENLFVLRALAHEYNLWPENEWDGKEALKFCEESRVQVKNLRNIVKHDGLDAGIGGMCNDYLTLIDEYESSLAQIGEIDSAARKQAFDDAFSTALIGGIKAIKAGVDADADGQSQLGVDLTVGKGLIDDGVIEFIKHSRARNAQTEVSASAEKARFEKVLAFVDEHNHAAALAMTERRHWAPGEAGFDPKKFDQPLDDAMKEMPRDPFLKMEAAGTGIDEKTGPVDFIDRARLALEAARQVPAGETFDSYRKYCVTRATEFACNAAELGIDASYHDAPTALSKEAINITKEMLQLDPADANGWAHVELFRALASAGRFPEAIAAAQPILNSPWKDKQAFAILYARVLGVTGDADGLDHWLRVAYALGYSDLKFVKESADFDCLRTKKPAAYAELTTVKGTTTIDFGVVNDDVIVKNLSPFPMTNLKMKFTVIQGGTIVTKERVLPFVAANSQQTLLDVFMVHDNKYDAYRWTVQSDQGKISSEDE
ncbi:MAG TPA: hypothetical protein VFE47_13155 [Tepidisphaeraceae bacterium]|jgi:tetratricopeptide (TPR) repeat protein|nr:hypothetical protein [Tepidisphaeraceae bacterium]